MRVLRVGIIGCGHVAHAHLPALRRLSAVQVVGCCDTDGDAAARVAREHGIGYRCSDPAELLDEVRPDVVHVLTPPATHRDLAILAMESGCHLVVEKPLAINASAAADVVAVARRTGRSLTVCHNLLFDPAVLEARELIALDALGGVLTVKAFWGYRHEWLGRFRPGHWVYDLPGGFFHESAPHPVYLLTALLGDLHVIAATAWQTSGMLPARHGALSVLFDGHAGPADVTFSLDAKPYVRWVAILGSKASLRIDLVSGRLEVCSPPRPDSFRGAMSEGRQVVSRALRSALRRRLYGRSRQAVSSHERFLRSFYERLLDGREPEVTGEGATSVVGVLDRIWAALASRAGLDPVHP